MFGPPQLWDYVTRDYLSLPPGLAFSWWCAIIRTKWTASSRWRDEFLHLANQHAVLTKNCVPDFLGGLVTLPTLIALIEGLMSERVLSRRDGRNIEEHLFAMADAAGAWKHEA
jgi:hypothetical protein